ncbi:glycosyltransferase family 2 protein [Paenibacillus zeisoli]|uniref:Glycosyltransferase family 2 protein n=1 Tax=Paenibacillus zeisoli TaxID=2496267 RepID=A0A3S1DVL9_9BACL|nr:glycosyltransferase family 2 protein [Paenibacillus zeisoli]RUT29149.1 glycosyltransferase family 2 protein [Paenibacillus zeisoli]
MPHRVRTKPSMAGHKVRVSKHVTASIPSESTSGPRHHKQFSRGWKAGYEQGVRLGQEAFTSRFEGTSIIIPTFNSRELLMNCIDSIEANTPMPYEIIVVDNASTDGTVEALRRRGGGIRVGVHQANLGFARAVNTGLMMSKGQNIAWLNPDMLVTEYWLNNMLLCLESRPDIGAVGPVTNNIEGPQQMEVSYNTAAEMRTFAAKYNQKDSRRWELTDRLASFCVLMKRETLEKTGYFDEDYRLRNVENNDWMIRLRYLGRVMVIAGDSFIHHVTSQTGGAPGFEEGQINEENSRLLADKWGDPYKRLHTLVNHGMLNPALKSADYFPDHILVSDLRGRNYWLENGIKRPVVNYIPHMHGLSVPVQMSILDLGQLVMGRSIRAEELRLRLGAGKLQNEGREGSLYRLSDGRMVQVQQNKYREFITGYAADSWGLTDRFLDQAPEAIQNLQEGLPILARNGLVSVHL